MNHLVDYVVAAAAAGIILACFLIVRQFIERADEAENRRERER
jgi:hypothetical protein